MKTLNARRAPVDAISKFFPLAREAASHSLQALINMNICAMQLTAGVHPSSIQQMEVCNPCMPKVSCPGKGCHVGFNTTCAGSLQ